MSSKQSTPSSTTQVTKTEPWAGQQSYLLDLFSRAQSQAGQGLQYFPGQQVAPRSNETQEAERMALGTAQGLQFPANAMLNSMQYNLGAGRDIGNDPYLQSAIQGAINPLLTNFTSVGGPLAGIRSHFTAANSGGSGTREGIAQGVAQRGLQQQVGDISSGMTWQAYQQAQDNALRTLALGPQTMQAAAYPASLVAGVGEQRDAYTQALIDAEMQKFNFNQQAPWAVLGNYGNLIQGNYGSSGSATTTAPAARRNPLLSGLGGAASGAALAGMIPALGPYALPAAGVGALLGLLG